MKFEFNIVPIIFICFTTVVGAIFGEWLIGLAAGLGFILFITFLEAIDGRKW